MDLTTRQQLVTITSTTPVEKPSAGENLKKYIAVHETGNPRVGANARVHANLQSAGNITESWHWQTDEHEAVQSYPHEIKCWHAGDANIGGVGLNQSIAIEICVNSDGDWLKALTNTAFLIRKIMDMESIPLENVKQHFDFSGKNCPERIRSGKHGVTWDGLLYLAANPEKGSLMQNPTIGRVSSEYGKRPIISGVTTSTVHAGIDIANVTGTPIRAAFAGTAVSAGVTNVPGRSGLHVLIRNPDGEAQYYGHVSRVDVKAGDVVREGQQIALMGATGNVTGPHLHFEVWSNWKDHKSHRNPRIDFGHYGIVPGVGGEPVNTTPASYLPLVADGDFGHRSVTELERALKKAGHYKGVVEADSGSVAAFGPILWKGVQSFLQLHGYYGFDIDGIAGEGGATKKGLQEWLRDVGNYNYAIDGLMPNKGESWKGLQGALNEGDVRNDRAHKEVVVPPVIVEPAVPEPEPPVVVEPSDPVPPNFEPEPPVVEPLPEDPAGNLTVKLPGMKLTINPATSVITIALDLPDSLNP